VMFDMIKALEDITNVYYWYEDGYLPDILKQLPVKPDFIFHYDIGWYHFLAPHITGLHETTIPKGAFVIDSHFGEDIRKSYFDSNQIDLIFSVTKTHFLNTYPEYEEKFRWLPWSINPEVFKDWKLEKSIDFLLMGLLDDPQIGGYPFRKAVLQKMKDEKGFVHHAHPGHNIGYNDGAIINEAFAQEINRSKIFFTCGSQIGYPVLKFFEVLGCRTLLLAESNQDILELGFKDGVHFIACDRTNFYNKAAFYLEQEEKREQIANNGFHFIHTNHTNEIRAKQFINEIKAFLTK
jgi:spore maturation protein CgeB